MARTLDNSQNTMSTIKLPKFIVTFTSLPTIVLMTIWVLGLWLWGEFLNLTPDIVDLIIIGAFALPATWLFWEKPEYGIITLMFFTSGFLSPEFVDIRLPIGGGLEMRDILLFHLFGLIFFQRLSRKNLTIPWQSVGGMLVIFLGIVMLSLINAIVFEGVPINWAFGDARILFFYLLFFIVGWSVTNEKTLYAVIMGSFVITDITALIVIIQQFLGPNTLVLESMKDGSWLIHAQEGIIRVVPPGIVYLYFMMLISLGFTIFFRGDRRNLLFWIFHTGFLGIGLIFTFTRSSWVATGITVALLLVVLFPVYRPYLVRILIIGSAALMLLVGAVGFLVNDAAIKNTTVSLILDRFFSIFEEETIESSSLQWRFYELQETTRAIEEQPFTGVGLGNRYRDISILVGEAYGSWVDGDLSFERYDRFTRYAHSSYLAIPVKMGIPGIVALLGFFALATIKSLSLYYKLPDGMTKGLVITVIFGTFGLLQWSFLHAQLMLPASTIVVALVLGLIASIQSIYIINPEPRKTG